MAYIEDIEKNGRNLLTKLGIDWLGNRLDPDTTFRVSSEEGGEDLETTLNYMLWRGWIEAPVLANEENSGLVAAVRLTPEGKSLAISHAHGKKPEPTPTPGRGRTCPY